MNSDDTKTHQTVNESRRTTIPPEVFDELVELMRARLIEPDDDQASSLWGFAGAMQSVVENLDGMHMIGRASIEGDIARLTIWMEYPFEDVWEVDELAFSIITQVADDLTLSSREMDDDGVRYRFVTGSSDGIYTGQLNFMGPNAKEFSARRRMQTVPGRHYHA